MEESFVTGSCSEEDLISLLLERGIKEIEPSLSYERGPEYYSSLGLREEDCPNLSELLESLSEKGLLNKHKIGSVPSCPNCGSFRLIVKLSCPVCGSTNIRRVDAITHLLCGHLAPAEEFSVGDALKCPKCGKPLRAIGVDYNRLSGVVVCEECGNISLSPKLELKCSDCGAVLSDRELSLKPVYKYEVNIEKLIASKPVLSELVRNLREAGLGVESPKQVMGVSGILHKFSLSVKDFDDRELMIDVVQGEKPVTEDKVLALFGKMVDSHISEATLVAVPKATEEAKALAKSFNIDLIEASNSDEAAEKILNRLAGNSLRRSNIKEEEII